MSIHIIIDGYNLIRQSPTLSMIDLQDLQSGREALIDTLAAYRKVKGHRITVVFDGTAAVGMGSARDRRKGIEIRFSRSGETADAVIKNMASREREKAVVVSSDQEVAAFAHSAGAGTIGSREFEGRLQPGGPAVPAFEGEDDGWVPTTRKKGPRRRLPKKDRRRRERIKKL